MAKTTFGPGVIVTSKFLNGAQNIYFDGQNLDWHYPPINSGDIQRGGTTGIDNVYVTVSTEQTFSGVPITGNKSFMGRVAFGDAVSSSPLAAINWRIMPIKVLTIEVKVLCSVKKLGRDNHSRSKGCLRHVRPLTKSIIKVLPSY